MLAPPVLVQQITRRSNCFLRKNLNYLFTADPFSAGNVPRQGDAGFAGKRPVALQPSRDAKAAPGSVVVLRKSRVSKAGKRRSLASAFSQKTLAAAQATGFATSTLTRRGAKLHALSRRAARLAAPAK